MSQMTDGPTGDLRAIGAQLSRAIRRDHQRRLRRHSHARLVAIVVATTALLSGTALAAADLTGAISLGGGHMAVPVKSTPAAGDPQLPYRYRLIGFHQHNDAGGGTIYIESSRPLSSLTREQLAAARQGCGPATTTINGAIVWVFDERCLGKP